MNSNNSTPSQPFSAGNTENASAQSAQPVSGSAPSASTPDAELDFQLPNVPAIPPLKPVKLAPDLEGGNLAEIKELLEETADDMVRLMEWLRRIESKQDETAVQVAALCQEVQDSKRETVTEMDRLRQDLLSERKALAARSSFNAVLPVLESMRLMRNGIPDAPENAQIRAQLNAVASALANIVQSLGFSEFEIVPGTVFDPFSMECVGYGEGEPGTVAEQVRPGYRMGNQVIRPGGVIVARASQDVVP